MLFCIVFNANLVVRRMQTTLNHSYCQYMQLCYVLIYYACNRRTYYTYRLRSHDFFLREKKSRLRRRLIVEFIAALKNATLQEK